MNLQKEVEKLILDNLKKTMPMATKQLKNSSSAIDDSTKVMGFKKITRPGYTP